MNRLMVTNNDILLSIHVLSHVKLIAPTTGPLFKPLRFVVSCTNKCASATLNNQACISRALRVSSVKAYGGYQKELQLHMILYRIIVSAAVILGASNEESFVTKYTTLHQR